jgi:hypothetical protein
VSGPAVTIVESGGFPVTSVESGAPAMTVVESGGVPVTVVESGGAPFILEGVGPDAPELWPQPTFAESTGLTLGSWTFAPGSVTSGGDTTFCSATALDTLTAGTYRIAYTIAANPEEDAFAVQIGGTGAAGLSSAPGSYSVDATIASVTTQVIRFRAAQGGFDMQITAFSVKQIESA